MKKYKRMSLDEVDIECLVLTHRIVERHGLQPLLEALFHIANNTIEDLPEDHPHLPMWKETNAALDAYINKMCEICDSAPELPAEE